MKDWNRVHRSAECYVPGVPYNPVSAPTTASIKFADVDCPDSKRGRVTGFTMYLSAPVPITVAKRIAHAELPTDAKSISDKAEVGCSEIIEYSSTCLRSTLHYLKNWPDAHAVFETYNLTGTTFDFDPTRVNMILFEPGTVDDSDPCG